MRDFDRVDSSIVLMVQKKGFTWYEGMCIGADKICIQSAVQVTGDSHLPGS